MIKYGIAITGGIATGKSTVCNILKLHGFTIIDADLISKNILDDSQEEVIEMFGKRYIKNGIIDRKELAKLIFSDIKQKRKLEHFLHPKISLEIKSKCDKLEKLKTNYIIDIPLLFETNNYNIEKKIVVYAPKKLQITRALKRDKTTKEDIMGRLSAQIDIEDKKLMADYIIDNTKDLKHLQTECEKFIQWLKI